MKIKTLINQFGLLIFVCSRFISVMYNGEYLKLKSKGNVNLNEIDSIMFYEMMNKKL